VASRKEPTSLTESARPPMIVPMQQAQQYDDDGQIAV
jgi:hypothetical protein